MQVRDDLQPFTTSNPNRVVNISREIMSHEANRSAWLLRSVQGLQELQRLRDFPEPESLRKAKEELRQHSNPIYTFWLECSTPEPTEQGTCEWQALKHAYTYYSLWAESAGLGRISARKFALGTQELHKSSALSNFAVRNSDRWEYRGRVVALNGDGTRKE